MIVKFFFGTGLILWILVAGAVAGAQENEALSSEANPVRVVSGVGFSVPADWPIEKRNGAVGPIPIEEYMALKFKKMEDRISVLEAKLAEPGSGAPEKAKPEKNRLQSYEFKPQTEGV